MIYAVTACPSGGLNDNISTTTVSKTKDGTLIQQTLPPTPEPGINMTLQKLLFSNSPESNGVHEKFGFTICTDKDEAKCCQGIAFQHGISKGCEGFELIAPTNKPFIETRFQRRLGPKKWSLECLELVMSDSYTQWVCRNITIVGYITILSEPKCEWVFSGRYPCGYKK